MKILKWITAASLAFIIVACCPCRKSKSAIVPLTGTEWKLAQFYDEPVESDNYRMTLVADGSINGVGDCNRFAGSFTMNAGQIKISDNLVSTRMFCPNQERENKFLKMLTEADAYSIDGARLMLIRNGGTIAIFSPAPVVAK